ncbi:EamA family transporter [Paenibacillus tarimensis]|uniref:EamA family transporter n=1 Tax=Paenibacillus tarimensis TaxID=416012 RepID=UPI001F233B37|nr:EamA family transporter [Paenibacillus tarimensis]MCF2943139.1 EamA/RhaT family transporter [Paenibacillus tarimensis]
MENVTSGLIGKGYMVFSAWLSATGQLLWSFGLTNYPLLAMGFLCYGLGALFMIKSLALSKLSSTYPLLSVGYVIAIIYGAYFHGEVFTWNKLLAVLLLGAGVTLTAYER